MKKCILLVAFIAAFLAAAGCITTEEPQDPFIGTWIAGEYTNAAGMHYLKIYETFYPDNTGVEKGYIDDGSTTQWEYIWLKKGDNYYEAYYSPITFTLRSSGMTGVADTGNDFVQDWEFVKVNGSPEYLQGTWESKTQYLFEEQMYSVNVEVYENGTGLMTFSNDAGKLSFSLTWSQIGNGMFVIALSQVMMFELKEDGKLYDNFGCIYTKV